MNYYAFTEFLYRKIEFTTQRLSYSTHSIKPQFNLVEATLQQE